MPVIHTSCAHGSAERWAGTKDFLPPSSPEHGFLLPFGACHSHLLRVGLSSRVSLEEEKKAAATTTKAAAAEAAAAAAAATTTTKEEGAARAAAAVKVNK